MAGPEALSLSNSLLDAHYMPRPRIDRLFDQATQCKLVYVIASAGYGKTQAARHYIEQQNDAIVRWLQLTESDNVGARYWDHLVHNISFDNPDLAFKLRMVGFPETPARFKQFAEILKTSEHRSFRTFLVLDDFHLINSKQALMFAERCAYLQIPGACVILISRKEPEMNIVPLLAKGQVHIITEEELRFTDIEISEYFKQRGIPFSSKNLPNIINSTKGWAFAIQLLSLSLSRLPAGLDFALETMKQNIFKLMEIEAFNDFPESTKKLMVKLSLTSNLPIMVLQKLFADTTFIQEAPQLAAFVWHDSLTGEDRIHPLYWDFLKTKQDILSDDEKNETYLQSAEWCIENEFKLDAVYFYHLLQDYDRVLEILLSYPFKISSETGEYFLQIIESIDPQVIDQKNHSVLLLKNFIAPLLLLWMDRYDEAIDRCFNVIREWENSDSPFAVNLLYTTYSNLAYISLYTCTITHRYDFLEYLKKSVEYYKMSSIPPLEISGAFAIADLRSFACVVGEGADLSEFDQFVEASRQTSKYVAQTSHGMYYGYDELAACELAFYKNQLEKARNHAHQAILNARERNQHSIEAMAAFYLFRIAIMEGNYPLVKDILKQGRNSEGNPNFWNRHLLYNLAITFFYAQSGLPQLAPSWLTMDDRDAAYEVSVPIRELISGAKYYFAVKKYDQALTFLCHSYPRKLEERFLFGELTLTLLTAAAKVRAGDISGAVKDFKEAYAHSLNGVFEMPFIELGKDLHPLVVAASEQADCGIPDEWLKAIDRKSSIYSKKLTVITNAFKGERNIKDTVQLSERELEVLNDLYCGLSRDEIAANRYLSINTVKKLLQSIFIKLDASNNVDAIRIGIERKLIG